jgi:gamma-glutamylcyclotransferase (GGCT)/AIG2-like uncharacterized protein YtfP
MHRLAAYGSLCVESLMRELTGREFASEPAVIVDHLRRRLRDRTYPGIVARAGCETAAVLYHDVDVESLAILDAFEVDLYQRREVAVRSASGELSRAMAYVVAEPHVAEMTDEEWSLEGFRLNGQAEFYTQYVRRFHQLRHTNQANS